MDLIDILIFMYLNFLYLNIFMYLNIFGIYLIYNIMLSLGVLPGNSVIYILFQILLPYRLLF